MIPFVAIGPAADYPAEADVESGVDYDYGNLTGTLTGGGGATAEEIAAAVWANTERTITGTVVLAAVQPNHDVEDKCIDAIESKFLFSSGNGVVVGTNEMGVDLATTLNTGTLQTILTKLDTMMVLDGSVYQFTANALDLGPSGGSGTLNVTILPGRDRALPQSSRSRIVVAVGERITISRQVLDGNGQPLSLAGRTLQLVIQDARGTDLAVVPDDDITVSGTANDTYSFVVPAGASARVGNFTYALNDVGTSKAELVKGDWIVESRPLADS